MPVNMLPGLRATKIQRRVLSRYLENGGDKVDAYWYGTGKQPKPGQSKKVSRDIAHNYFQGSTMKALMLQADIEARVKLEKQAAVGVENAISTYGITKDRIMAELAKIAFAQHTDVASWGPDGVIIKDSKDIGDAAAAVSEVSQSGGGEKSPVSVKIKLMDKQQALMALGKELGMFTEKHEVKGAIAVGAKFIVEK